jgi:hypothetical protein
MPIPVLPIPVGKEKDAFQADSTARLGLRICEDFIYLFYILY